MIKKNNLKYINIEELDLPRNVYKYRTWSEANHKTILSDQVVYFSSPFDFEDAKDCKSQKRFDLLTQKDIYNHYLQYSQNNYPEKKRQQHRKYARDLFKKSPMHHLEHIREIQESHMKDFAVHHGVLSLTAIPNNYEMWTKYSENHLGICVGFNPILLFKSIGCAGGKVLYFDELPIIYPKDDYDVEYFKQIFCKEKKWEFEDEYRTIKLFNNGTTKEGRQIKLPKECYTEIIFGFSTRIESKVEIKKICEIQGLNVAFKQVVSIKDEQIEIIPDVG